MLRCTRECRHLFEVLCAFLLGVYSEVGLLNPTIILFLTFWGTVILCSTMVTTVYIPINSKIYIPATVPFLYMLADIYLYFLNDNYPNRCEVISLCGVIRISLTIRDIEYHFKHLWSFVYLLWKNVYSVLLLIFIQMFWVFCYWVVWGLNTLSDIWFVSVLSHSIG